MLCEPHKIKTIRNVRFTTQEKRLKKLSKASFNTFRIKSKKVTFDMTTQGTAAMSQEQLSGILLGDEAYAGSVNFKSIEKAVGNIFGRRYVCPTHSLRGALKLIAHTMVSEGDVILSNSPAPAELCKFAHGRVEVAASAGGTFSGDVDVSALDKAASGNVPFIYAESFAGGYRPVSLKGMKALRKYADEKKTTLIFDASRVVENAAYLIKNEKTLASKTVAEVVRMLTDTAHVVVMDAAQDARCNVGGLITTDDASLHEKYQNMVVVFEGLHTYGGMAGRTMEIFARGIDEMIIPEQAEWIDRQVAVFVAELEGIPLVPGCDGAYLKAAEFLPNVKTNAAQTLAAALFLKSGVRAFLEGRFADEELLPVQLPRLALNMEQVRQIAAAIRELYEERDQISGLTLKNEPDWHDQAEFEWDAPELKPFEFDCEPYVITTIERVGVTTPAERAKYVKEAGYNTFLLPSDGVSIDLLTDSGTTAMSVKQWKKYIGGVETPASAEEFEDFVEEIQEVTGYKYVVPTHQGREAEHIMSQVLIHSGHVPGNMYFTTTKLHQEMAGGTFADVIVDQAHDPTSDFPWKGNIDLAKLKAIVDEFGADSVPYISFEFSVNMAGGQPVSMDNAREVYEYCKSNNIYVMWDATRCAENAYMIKKKDPSYKDKSIKEITRELFSYGDGCTVSSKKDCLVNIGGFLAYRDSKELYEKSLDMLRAYEGTVTNGGISAGDMAVHAQGMREMVEERYIRSRVEQTQYLGNKLLDAGVPIVQPPGSHAIFLDAKRFLPHIDQDNFPAQALAAALYLESGVRAMERGNVSKGRNPETGENYRPHLELVRLTIPRRAYTRSHMDKVAEAVIALHKKKDEIKGLKFVYEPKALRFFQSRFEEI